MNDVINIKIYNLSDWDENKCWYIKKKLFEFRSENIDQIFNYLFQVKIKLKIYILNKYKLQK